MIYGILGLEGLCLAWMGICGTRLLRSARLPGGAILAFLLGNFLFLLPRLLELLLDRPLAVAVGLGELGELLGTTAGWLMLYQGWETLFSNRTRDRLTFWTAWGGGLLTILFAMAPGNRWLQGGGSDLWTALRTFPLTVLAAAVTTVWFSVRTQSRTARWVWLLLAMTVLCRLIFPLPFDPIVLKLPSLAVYALLAACLLGL